MLSLYHNISPLFASINDYLKKSSAFIYHELVVKYYHEQKAMQNREVAIKHYDDALFSKIDDYIWLSTTTNYMVENISDEDLKRLLFVKKPKIEEVLQRLTSEIVELRQNIEQAKDSIIDGDIHFSRKLLELEKTTETLKTELHIPQKKSEPSSVITSTSALSTEGSSSSSTHKKNTTAQITGNELRKLFSGQPSKDENTSIATEKVQIFQPIFGKKCAIM
jgi:hypothetical protein